MMFRQWLKQLWCTIQFNHFDPGIYVIAQRIDVCKKCGKIIK